MASSELRTLPLQVAVWFRRPSLDGALAAGVTGSDLLRLRAEQLVRPRERARIAHWIELVMSEQAGHTRDPGDAALQRVAIALAHADLVWLVAALRTMSDPSPRGVAMAQQLVRDDHGPLYTACSGTALRDQARRIGAAL
jgi:hypothetical protein